MPTPGNHARCRRAVFAAAFAVADLFEVGRCIGGCRRAALAAALAAVCLAAGPIRAQEDIEVRELRAALEKARADLADQRERSAELEKQRKELTESLAEAVRVSEEQVAAARETKLKLQAFGVDLFTRGENGLEQRLLKAVRDLDICRQDLERQSAALHALSEAFLGYLEATPDAPEEARSAARASIEEARGAIETGGSPEAPEEEPISGDLSDTRVVSIDSEIGLVVLDAGSRDGLRIGTPVAVLQEGRPIYSALVVDVRDAIAGAVLQDRLAESGEVAVGDGIELMPERTNL